MKTLIDKLEKNHILLKEEFCKLIISQDYQTDEYLFEKARNVRHAIYGNSVYIRGLIELTNCCKNDCFYCGIRKSNKKAQRYRLTLEEVLKCAENGYSFGFRTFVLQGGEDPYFTNSIIAEIITSLKSKYPDCAITLSLGEKSRQSYQTFYDAGADRYLLRHETANSDHYTKLHPPKLTLEKRKSCLMDLKEIGFQVGCGLMVGSPFQTLDCLVDDLFFISKLNPHMVGIGPFIPHKDTPFLDKSPGSVTVTLKLLAMVRLMLPHVLLPATTALGTLDKDGREKGILAGANVVMPNLSPNDVRHKYLLYDNKLYTGVESAEALEALRTRLEDIGYSIKVGRGDPQKF